MTINELIYDPPKSGDQIFADFYALELMKSLINQKIHNNKKVEVVEGALSKVVFELANRMFYYLIAESASELSYIFGGYMNDLSWMDPANKRKPANYWKTRLSGGDYFDFLRKQFSADMAKKINSNYDLAVVEMYYSLKDARLRGVNLSLAKNTVDAMVILEPLSKEIEGWNEKWIDNKKKTKHFLSVISSKNVSVNSIKFAFTNNVFWTGAGRMGEYGGSPWAEAFDIGLKLGKAIQTHNQKEMILLIDKTYDLYHNTGHVLNKDEDKTIAVDYKLLDIRHNIKHIKEFYDLASGPIKGLIKMVVHSLKEPTI